MSMRAFVVESPFVSLLVRPFECCLHFRNVNNNYVNQTSLVLCVLRPGERNGCDSVTVVVLLVVVAAVVVAVVGAFCTAGH